MPNPPKANQWHYPTDIIFGENRIQELPQLCAQLNIHNALIVCDQGLAKFDFIQAILQLLPKSALFSEVKANPNGANVEAGVSAYQQGKHDGVVAVGGGSALDAGKAIALMVGQRLPIWDFEDVGDNWRRVKPEGIAPLIAVPTTAGTGSEVGRTAVIVDEQSQLKKIIFHPKMLPAKVILDPVLTLGLPAGLTAATGIDAFVHSFEAFCATAYHPMADGIALESMALIKQWLPIAFSKGSDLSARSHMQTASMMGATAFQKGLGAVHALAHPLGAVYDKHHGLLNAILLPYVVMTNRSAIGDKVETICRYLDLDIQKSGQAFEAFMEWLLAFRMALKIPHSLAEIGIDEIRAQEIAAKALMDPSARGNPLALNQSDYHALLIRAIRGELK